MPVRCRGPAAAAIAPAALALAMDGFPPEYGAWQGAGGVGCGLRCGGRGRRSAGRCAHQAWGWPWIFHSVAFGAVLVLAAVAVLVPRDAVRETAGRFDLLGTVTVTLALTCLVWGLTTARGAYWGDPPVLGALGGAVVLLAAFCVIERGHRRRWCRCGCSPRAGSVRAIC